MCRSFQFHGIYFSLLLIPFLLPRSHICACFILYVYVPCMSLSVYVWVLSHRCRQNTIAMQTCFWNALIRLSNVCLCVCFFSLPSFLLCISSISSGHLFKRTWKKIRLKCVIMCVHNHFAVNHVRMNEWISRHNMHLT